MRTTKRSAGDEPRGWRKINRMRGLLALAVYGAAAVIVVFLLLYWTGVIGGGSLFVRSKTVGKDIELSKVQQFYFTYSTSTNPPHYQRYRFYVEDGKYWFYHEQREGDHWPLTEDDVTVSGTRELSLMEREAFWDLLKGGKVVKRELDITTGRAGPWLYIYWDGDRGEWQQFSFADPGLVLEFEDFCEGLKEK